MQLTEAIQCTLPNCHCDCFSPGSSSSSSSSSNNSSSSSSTNNSGKCGGGGALQVRTCDSCKHGWVAHALDKLGYRSMYQLSGMNVEIVQPNIVFDIASLMLYGAHATPIRLKILLDRLFSVLQHEEVLQVLHGFGWTYEDYARGYILQDPSGKVLDKWTVCTREEEQVILQQFLRFGETKSIAEEIILQDARENRKTNPAEASEIKKFIERSTPTSSAFALPRGYDPTRFPLYAQSHHLSPLNPLVPSVSPNRTAATSPKSTSTTPKSGMSVPLKTSASSPVSASSPLSRLQGMQPYDFRKDQLSPPLTSPALSEGDKLSVTTAATPSVNDALSPQNLSVTSSSSSVPTTPSKPLPQVVEPIKIEPIEEHPKYTEKKEEKPEEVKYSSKSDEIAKYAKAVEDLAKYSVSSRSADASQYARSEELSKYAAAQNEEYKKYAARQEELAKYARSKEELAKYAAQTHEEMARFSHSDEVAKYTSRMMETQMPKEDPSGALDYSVKESPSTQQPRTISSIYAEQKVRHLRKSANPMKRNYSPTPGYGGTLISPSGKKRVLCTACNKTFCDKGALKIHYSAVHLKEMHKCTVDGCNMMFSSRRSRNRHSANPNPKLHMPQNRRKLPEGAIILDEKSESARDFHSPRATCMPTSMPGLMNHQPPRDAIAPIATMPMEHHAKHLAGSGLMPHAGSMAALTAMMSSTSAFYLGAAGHNLAAFMPKPPKMPKFDQVSPNHYNHMPHHPMMSMASPNVHQQQQTQTLTTTVATTTPTATTTQANMAKREDSEVSSTRQREELSQLASKEDTNDHESGGSSRRKRKSMQPTRCAQTEEMFDMSDDNDEVVSMPDSGSDIEEGMVPTADSLKSVSSDLDSMDEDSQTRDDTSFMKDDELDDSQNSIDVKHTDESVADLSKNGLEDRATANKSFSEIRDNAIKQMNSIGMNISSSTCDSVLTPFSAAALMAPHSKLQDNGSLDLSLTSRYMQSPNGEIDYDIDEDLEREFDNIMDKDNPCRCPQCGKMFQTHFMVKAHYQTTHLKLVHTCTVEGCNAAFPSKRSRDRHASNLNLHRKLLSTTSSEAEPIGAQTMLSQTLRDEYLARMYGTAHYTYMQQMALAAGYDVSAATSEALAKMRKENASPGHNSNDESGTSNKENHSASPSPGATSCEHNDDDDEKAINNNKSSHDLNQSVKEHDDEKDKSSSLNDSFDERRQTFKDEDSCSSARTLTEWDPEDLPKPDPDGSVSCHVCQQKFRDNLVLKEHFEKLHPKEMFYCTISGCNKIFSTRKSRNRHSQNDNLHKHLLLGKSNGIHA